MPPPVDSALQIKPLAVLRSLLAVVVAYGVHYLMALGAILLAWGNLVQAPSAVLVPAAVIVLLASLVSAGAVAGRLAGGSPGGHGLMVGAAALVVLVVGLFADNMLEPWWFRVVGAVVSLPMAYLGAELAGYSKGVLR